MIQIIFPILGYLLGSVPFGLLFGRAKGLDIRTQGSKNIGATNVSRLLGKKLGLLTLVCDSLKGLLPMALAAAILAGSKNCDTVVALTGVAAVLGHMYSVFLGFRGGKGVATGLGVFLFLSPLAIGISLLVFLGTVFFTGFVSAGSLFAAALMPVLLFFLGAPAITISAAFMVAALIWFKHRENIERLLAGKEKSWKQKKAEKSSP